MRRRTMTEDAPAWTDPALAALDRLAYSVETHVLPGIEHNDIGIIRAALADALTPNEALVVHAALVATRDERFLDPLTDRAIAKLRQQAELDA
jgi:hypothetical protein